MWTSFTLRDGGNSQGNFNLEVVDSTADPRATMDRVVEVAYVDGPDGNTDQGDNLGQLLAELVQFCLQGSLLLLSGGHLVTDLADLSGDSCGNDNTNGLASSNVSALERSEEEQGKKTGSGRLIGHFCC